MNILDNLKKYNQEYLLKIINKMNDEQKKKIINELNTINFEKINNLYEKIDKKNTEKIKIEPIKYVEREKILGKYEEKGEKIIKNNKFAVITMAGGQGSRLGHNGPKGTFMLDIKGKSKSIFEVLSENFMNAKKDYGVDIPWYIMTSNNNDKETQEFFAKNNNFGLKEVKFFKQIDIPVVDENGNLLVGEDFLIKKAGNGNGGIYKALKENKILADLEEKGIEWILICGVDNILVKMVDPLFLGFNLAQGTEIASKSSSKLHPDEKVGIFCKKNGRCGIVEYTEVTDEMKQELDEHGKNIYNQINILHHLYSLNALKKLKDVELRYHIAHKKNSYLNENLELVYPTEPNIYKFEQFIFDGFEEFDNMSLLCVNREEEFAPIKNPTGNESPETAIELYIKEKKL